MLEHEEPGCVGLWRKAGSRVVCRSCAKYYPASDENIAAALAENVIAATLLALTAEGQRGPWKGELHGDE